MADDKGMNPAVAGAVGVAVGAAVGVAAAELADKDKREAVAEKVGELKEQGQQMYSDLKDKIAEVTDDAKKGE